MKTFTHTLTRSLIFSLIFVLISAAALGIYMYEKVQTLEGKVYPNVMINGTSFGGKTKQDIHEHFEPINQDLNNVSVEIAYEDTVATFSGEMVNLAYNPEKIADQVFMVGRSEYLPSRILEKVQSLFNFRTYNFNYTPSYNLDPIQDHLSELDEVYSIPPQNALFEFNEGKVTSFQIEEPGFELQTEPARQSIKNFLVSDDILDDPSRRFVVEAEVIEPDIKIEDINEFGIEEKIGEGKSDYTGSSEARSFNVELAASKFHGVLIPPGEVFSYNETIGRISRATGYKTSYVIKGGRTVLGDGGGVCQDSTTLFRAALNTGLPIVERHAHGYRVKYYENDRKPGFDATVYAPSVDFKFKNDTDAHILIQSRVDEENKLLTFEFYGKDDGRTVELSDAKVYGYQPAPEPVYEETPALPKGVVKQVDWAAPGAKSEFTYKVTSADGEIIQDRTFYSSFRPWRAVYQVGTGE